MYSPIPQSRSKWNTLYKVLSVSLQLLQTICLLFMTGFMYSFLGDVHTIISDRSLQAVTSMDLMRYVFLDSTRQIIQMMNLTKNKFITDMDILGNSAVLISNDLNQITQLAALLGSCLFKICH